MRLCMMKLDTFEKLSAGLFWILSQRLYGRNEERRQPKLPVSEPRFERGHSRLRSRIADRYNGSYGLRKYATDNVEGFSDVSAGIARLSDVKSEDGTYTVCRSNWKTFKHFVSSNSIRWCYQACKESPFLLIQAINVVSDRCHCVVRAAGLWPQIVFFVH